jgi:FlgN protein
LSLAPQEPLSVAVLTHLDAQITSVQGLLEIVLQQGAAIRSRDVHAVVKLAGLLYAELTRREEIECERALLLERAAAELGIEPGQVTVTRLVTLMDASTGRRVAERSAQLRGLLEELRREHGQNRAIMQIELSFLDHLMQSLALDGGTHGYDTRGSVGQGSHASQPGTLHVLDLQA